MPTQTPSPTREYMATTDSKKRVVLRNPSAKTYKIQEFEEGYVLLIPCKVVPDISEKTLKQIEKSIKNMASGNRQSVDVDEAINLYK